MKRIIIPVICLLIFSSCKKSNNPDNPETNEPEECRITIIEELDGRLNYTYDNQGRITEAKYTDYRGIQEEKEDFQGKFTYQSNKISLILSDISGKYSEAEYNLNAQGLIVSSSIEAREHLDSGTFSYKYDGNGYLIEVIENNNIVSTFQYQNGNLIQRETKNDAAGYRATVKYTYDLNKEAGGYSVDNFGVNNLLYDLGYFGKRSKNRITRMESREEYDGYSNDFSTTTYQYEEDSSGKITKINMHNSNWTDQNQFLKLTYKCI